MQDGSGLPQVKSLNSFSSLSHLNVTCCEVWWPFRASLDMMPHSGDGGFFVSSDGRRPLAAPDEAVETGSGAGVHMFCDYAPFLTTWPDSLHHRQNRSESFDRFRFSEFTWLLNHVFSGGKKKPNLNPIQKRNQWLLGDSCLSMVSLTWRACALTGASNQPWLWPPVFCGLSLCWKAPTERLYLFFFWNAGLKSLAKSMHPFCDFLFNREWKKKSGFFFESCPYSSNSQHQTPIRIGWPDRCHSVMSDGFFNNLRGIDNNDIAQCYTHACRQCLIGSPRSPYFGRAYFWHWALLFELSTDVPLHL